MHSQSAALKNNHEVEKTLDTVHPLEMSPGVYLLQGYSTASHITGMLLCPPLVAILLLWSAQQTYRLVPAPFTF